MLSSGQLLKDEEREPTLTPAIPEEGIYEVKYTNKRTNVVRLLPNGFQERKLRRLANISAKLYNEINYERRQQFFQQQHKIDFKGTWVKYYEKYKGKLGVNTQAIMQKNNEAWSSFFSLLKLKKKGKLPPHMKHLSPPKYWKDRECKKEKRKLILIIRQDRYIVDEKSNKIILKDFNLKIDFAGRLRWYGKQGRLEIYYDETKHAWYASIPIDVGVETTTKKGNKSKHIVKGERKTIQITSPKGDKVASIDLGINVLASVITNDGTWLLYKCARAKEDYFYLQKKISEVQSLADKAKNISEGEYEAYEELRKEKRRLEGKLRRRLLHLYRTFASDMLGQLHKLGISTIYLGYPFNIAQDKGNKFNANMWSYRKLMDTIELKAQEYGIRVFEVVEYNTSHLCAFHSVEITRNPRGVIHCPLGHKLHSDLNGTLNILKKATNLMVSAIKKPLSFIVGHNGVAPITVIVKGCNP
jgi:putative transposase